LLAPVGHREAVPVAPTVIELVAYAAFDGEVARRFARREVLERDPDCLHDDHAEIPPVVDVAGESHERLDTESAPVQARVHHDGRVAEAMAEVGVVGDDQAQYLL
jgi:hypothetical protein